MTHMIVINMSNFLMFLSLSPSASGALPDLTRNTLQATADKWFHWLEASTVVVALGVALEAWEATITLKRWYLLKRNKEAAEENYTNWAIPASYLGLVLVVAGVAGESVFEALVSNADTALRRHDLRILADTQLDAAIARKDTEQLGKDTQGLKTEAETQRGIAAGALQKAGEANATAEKERLERVKLEALVSPRLLTIDQRRKIGAACANLYTYGPRKRIKLHAYGLDIEARTLLIEIQSALASSRLYTFREEGGIISSGEFDTGIFISAPPEDIDFAVCLQKALSGIGKLKGVSVNAPRHGGTTFTGNATMGGVASIQGGGADVQTHPPPGSPVEVFVGVKPLIAVNP